MKQKICSRILSIYNSLLWVVFFSFGIWGMNSKFGLKYPFSAAPFVTEYQNVINFFNIIFICSIVINIFFGIQNRKNKKMIYWYIIPILYYIISVLAVFQVDIPEFFSSTAWAIIPAIVIAINLIYEIKHQKKKRTIILQALGVIMCIVMFFVNTYSSTIWLLISSVMLFIYGKDAMDNSKSIKIINTMVIILMNILLIIGIAWFLILISNMHKIDDETNTFINQIKSGLAQESANKNDTLIPVCKNDKWGYINTLGEEFFPCEYDAVSPEVSNLNGTVKYNFFILKKGDEFFIVSKNGKILATQTGSPVPWNSGDMKEMMENVYGGNDDSQKYQGILMSAREIISQYIGNEQKYTNQSEKNTIEYDDLQYTNNKQRIYIFNMEDDYILEFEEMAQSSLYDYEKYIIRLKKDGKIIQSYDNVNVNSIYEIKTYTNGDIPFYSFENNIQGYYSRKNHEFVTLKGKYEILDVLDDVVLIKDWRDISNIKDMIVKQGEGILLKETLISVQNNGYIVKKENGKTVYVDKNLNEITDEYNLIIDTYISNGVLICANKNNNKKEYVLANLKGKILTNTTYDIMLTDFDFDESWNTDYAIYDLHSQYESYYYNHNDEIDDYTTSNNTDDNTAEKETSKDKNTQVRKNVNTDGTLAEITSENYGDYIDLGKNVIGNNTSTDDWRILYNDTEKGKVYAILADYLPISTGIAEKAGLEASYSVYSNIDRDTLLKGFESNAWKSLISSNLQNKIDVKGAVTADILMDSYNEKHHSNLYYTDNSTYLYNTPNDKTSGIDTLYVLPGTDNEDYEKNDEYWLNSPITSLDNLLRTVNEKGKFDAANYSFGAAVRPIAIISSNIKVTNTRSNGQTIWKIAE